MIAAIYARKSTEQNGVSNDQKSVTRQIEHATAYALKKSWTVSEDHIYTDDGISGAEFVKRPGFIRPMNALKPAPPFQILIMNEESRLGREQIKTAYALQRLTDTGVQVWFYLSNQERKLDTAMDKIMGSLTGFASEIEREQAQQRTYDAMMRKAKAGHVTGGSVFGYDNIDIVGTTPDAQGRAKRSHVELRINEAEAEVVRKMFRLYTAGHGFTSITKGLNADGTICPRPSFSKPHGWASSSVRQVILRRLYVGDQVWGRTKKRAPLVLNARSNDRSTSGSSSTCRSSKSCRPNSGKRHKTTGRTCANCTCAPPGGRLHGRPTNGHESPYLLTGFTACKECKG
jgi:DNA invertase Pin-like site-specific DNA recombinase